MREVLGLVAEHRIGRSYVCQAADGDGILDGAVSAIMTVEVQDERDHLTAYIHGRAPRAQPTA